MIKKKKLLLGGTAAGMLLGAAGSFPTSVQARSKVKCMGGKSCKG